ncbi:PAS domain-containing protein [Hyphomonas sp.]|uniref:PAS domain-containing protein n=1 Tax=Hyphomonas sp. TaxID=87 RepID=UPI003D296B57|tara:strand:- start:1858 stop:2358 length:501 start_codon:yes stop_codon:yes gene_type:complete
MSNKTLFQGVTIAQQELINYWKRLRDRSGCVPRDEIDPGALRSMLASISIVQFDESGDGRFRIAGSRLRDIFGMEARGRRIAEVVGAHGEAFSLGLSVALERRGPVGGVIEQEDGMHAWLRLPLADSNGQLTMVLCHDEMLPSRRMLFPKDGQTSAVHNSSPRAAA